MKRPTKGTTRNPTTVVPTAQRPSAPHAALPDRWTRWAEAVAGRYGRAAQRRLGLAMTLAVPPVPLVLHGQRWARAASTLAPRIHLAIHPILQATAASSAGGLVSGGLASVGQVDRGRSSALGIGQVAGGAVLRQNIAQGTASSGYPLGMNERSGRDAPGFIHGVGARVERTAARADSGSVDDPAAGAWGTGMMPRMLAVSAGSHSAVHHGALAMRPAPAPGQATSAARATTPLQRVFVRAGKSGAQVGEADLGVAAQIMDPAPVDEPVRRQRFGMIPRLDVAARATALGQRLEVRPAQQPAMLTAQRPAPVATAADRGPGIVAPGTGARTMAMRNGNDPGMAVEWGGTPAPAADPAPLAVNVAQLADQVIHQLDQRLSAHRERMGKSF